LVFADDCSLERMSCKVRFPVTEEFPLLKNGMMRDLTAMYEKLPFWTIDTVDKNCGTFAHAWPPFVAVGRGPKTIAPLFDQRFHKRIQTLYCDQMERCSHKWQRKIRVLAPLPVPFNTNKMLGNLRYHSWSLGWNKKTFWFSHKRTAFR
jgi:hypothetical protein